jgi:hypothetical protein
MAKNSITDYDNIAANNTDIQSVDIDEGCAPSGINNAIRELMADLADVNDGTVPLASPDINGGTIDGVTIGSTTAGAGTFTTVTADGLGIGTTSPTDLVHLKEANGTATSTQLLLHNNNTGSGSAGIAFQVTGDGETASYAPKGAILFERTAANGRGAFKFMSDNADDTNPFSAADEVMRIAASGNVGIGTSSPSYAIDTLSSGAIVAQFKRNASGGGSGGIRFGNNDKQFTLYGDNSNGLTIYDGSTERMRIDSSGRVAMPYQPAFSVGGSSNTYITQSPILFDNIELNRNNVYNSSTGVFTAPVSGAYKFDAHIYCRCTTGQTAFPRIQKSTNGGALWTNFSYAYIADQASGQVDTTLNINVIMNLNANDLVRVIFGGTGDYYHGNEETRFSGFLIG